MQQNCIVYVEQLMTNMQWHTLYTRQLVEALTYRIVTTTLSCTASSSRNGASIQRDIPLHFIKSIFVKIIFLSSSVYSWPLLW